MNAHLILKPCAGEGRWYEVMKEVTFPGEWLLSKKIERSTEGGVLYRSTLPRQAKPKKVMLFMGLWQDKTNG